VCHQIFRKKLNYNTRFSGEGAKKALFPESFLTRKRHIYSDAAFGTFYLKGTIGDKVNVLLCGIGHDLRIIMRKPKLLWIKIFWGLYFYFGATNPGSPLSRG
jgi:hypothetical protein